MLRSGGWTKKGVFNVVSIFLLILSTLSRLVCLVRGNSLRGALCLFIRVLFYILSCCFILPFWVSYLFFLVFLRGVLLILLYLSSLRSSNTWILGWEVLVMVVLFFPTLSRTNTERVVGLVFFNYLAVFMRIWLLSVLLIIVRIVPKGKGALRLEFKDLV